MKRIILPLILGICSFLTSCEEILPDEKLVSVSLSYSLSANNGESMYSTKSDGAAIFSDFYAKIMDGTLIAPGYDLTFTDAATGETYPVKGKWSSNDIVSLKPGTYDVTGTSTAEGRNIQQKCSITLKDRVSVNEGSTSITIDASYDCSLIIFSDSTIAEIYNDNGTGTKEAFFKFEDCFYAFVRTTLYEESTKNDACLSGVLTNGSDFTVPTAGLTLGSGKYYVYSSINTAFSLPEMENGGGEGQEGGEDIKYVQFEDANFKAFCIEQYDKDGDGEISEAEALIPTSLEINTDEIESLEGINSFANITELVIEGSGGKRGIDKGSWTGTGDTDAVPDPEPSCTNATGKLVRLDISKLYNLESLSISCNVLEDLKLPDSANLCVIDVSFTRLRTLDISKNTALTRLQCYDNQIYSLDISNNTDLLTLFCYNNNISYIYVWPGFNENEYPNFIKDATATYVEKSKEQIDTKDYPSAIRGVWESTNVEIYKNGKVVKGDRVASEIFGFGDDGILTEIDIDLVYCEDNDEDCYSKMYYSVRDDVVYLNGIVPMTIKKLTSSELQLEESTVTSVFSDYDKMVISFKKRTGIEDYAEKILGKWLPYYGETIAFDGSILESYNGEDEDEEYMEFDGKTCKIYYPEYDEFDSSQYKVECGCLIIEADNTAFKITELTDTDLCLEAFDFYQSHIQGEPADCIERSYFKRSKD